MRGLLSITKRSQEVTKKFDYLLDGPYPRKSTSVPSIDTSLQDLIKTMSNQIAYLRSQFEEFKCQDEAPSTQRDLSVSQEHGMSALDAVSQARRDFSDGELSEDGLSTPI